MSEIRMLAEMGERLIQAAILNLLEKHEEGLLLGKVAKPLGLPEQGYNAAITGQLHLLKEQGKVHQPRGAHTKWLLTPEERSWRLR